MTGQLQDDLFNLEPLTEGSPNLTVPLVNLEPLAEGQPNTQVNLFVLEPLSESVRHLRANLFVLESLQPVVPEFDMTTTPFPGFGNSTIDPTKPAAADPFNTALPGLAFSVHKKPLFKTNIHEAPSGKEVRNSMAQYPRWEFNLTYEFLEDKTGADSSLKTIMGFFMLCGGSFAAWLFKDPDDYLVVNGLCGVADGTITAFPFLRDMGGFPEQVGQVDQSNDINVYVDGVLQDPGDYTINGDEFIFTSAPSSGNVTADFQFFFVCRFLEDQLDFEKFMDKLWQLQECDFRSIIQ